MIDAPTVAHVAELVPQRAFLWFCTIMTGGVAGWWFCMDAVRMRGHLRALKAAKVAGATDAAAIATLRDQIFGSTIGMVIGLIGVAGVIMYLR